MTEKQNKSIELMKDYVNILISLSAEINLLNMIMTNTNDEYKIKLSRSTVNHKLDILNKFMDSDEYAEYINYVTRSYILSKIDIVRYEITRKNINVSLCENIITAMSMLLIADIDCVKNGYMKMSLK